MATSLKLKKDEPPPSPQPQHVIVPSFSGTSIAFGGADSSDEETPREFFIRTAIDVEFGKENGQFIVRSATIERLVDWITLNHEGWWQSLFLLVRIKSLIANNSNSSQGSTNADSWMESSLFSRRTCPPSMLSQCVRFYEVLPTV